ncbi:flagellar hook-length control protein FliK [Variovorax sp. ZT4R33]|uniref:flagellar hook-length control protein FliK n=1 Tax=Variovorax sp. ZT4R33 TaxID=3443743 RepID=UPI003F47D88E
MTGLVRLLDTLLTAKVSPPLDAGVVDANASVKAPGAAAGVQKVVNDVRLQSNAGLERELGGVDSASARGVGPGGVAAGGGLPASAVARLSFAARIISAVLADLEVDVGPVRGQRPVWAPGQQPAGPALAGALAQTVSASGVFYESHLIQFAQGQRSLAQMAQEPQAEWPAPGATVSARSAVAAAVAAAPDGTAAAATSADPVFSSNPAPTAASAAAATAAVNAAQAASGLAAPSTGATPQGPQAGLSSTPADGASPGAAAVEAPSVAEATPDALKVQAAYRRNDAAASTTTAAAAERAALRSAEVTGGDRPAAGNAGASAPTGADVVHPQLVTLVHQQFDVLATAAFRWSGQAWPGVPMDWHIHEEDAGRQAAGEASVEAERRWSTRLSLHLPTLGLVDVRLSVAGADVRASVVAPSESSRARLAADGRTLAARFDAADLRLEQFQVAQGVVA